MGTYADIYQGRWYPSWGTIRYGALQGLGNNSIFSKWGFNEDVSTAYETVWDEGGLVTYPSGAVAMSVASTSTGDASAGNGARTVNVYGLDSNWTVASETVTLNGKTEVATTTTFNRVYRMTVETAGSSGENVGIIRAGVGSFTSGVPSTVYGRISVGMNQSLMGFYTCPVNRTLAVDALTISVSSSDVAKIKISVREQGKPFQAKGLFLTSASNVTYPLNLMKVPQKADVEVRAIKDSGAGTLDVSAQMTGVEMGYVA